MSDENRLYTLKDLFLLDPAVTFLNHGSFGATPRPVFEKYQWWQRELERQPVEFLGRRFNALMRDARIALAAYVHADADDLVYVPNATTGLNIVARSVRLEPGDEILTTDHEYGALDRTWRFICRRTGAVYKQQPIPVPLTTEENFIERVWSGVTPRTRVIFLSHITSPTALIFPVQEICRRARRAGIISIVDGAHAVGQIPLNLESIGADFYSSNLHKWLCCPKGSAFVYARREMQNEVAPLVVSWGYESEPLVHRALWTSKNGRARATSPRFSSRRTPSAFFKSITGMRCARRATRWHTRRAPKSRGSPVYRRSAQIRASGTRRW